MPASPFPLADLLLGLLAAVALMLALWVRQLRTRNATSVDVGWATGIGALAIAFAATGTGSSTQRLLAAGIAAVWSGRLATHLLRDRVFAGHGEDARYAALRARLGARAASGFALVYLVQAVLVAAFAVPFLVLAQHPGEAIGPLQWIGLAIATLGIAIETIADRTLAAHRRDPKNRGHTCRRGLWRLSRHPNYFGEWLVWCGIAALAAPAPHGAIAALAPILMYLLVRFVSGVPFAEQQALRSRGDDYRAYIAATNAFFPWFPRRNGGAP